MSQDTASLLESAQGFAESVENWSDLSNLLFDPESGLITRAYPTVEERKAFMQTSEYKAIRSLLLNSMKQSGLVAGSVPQKSGRFVVRLPKSLHAALEHEAENEGTSLNQLVVAKLAVQISQLKASPNTENAPIAQAYLETRDGYSTDRVIADPVMNRLFLHRCRELGVSGTDFDINWRLFNARKNRYLSNMPKTRRYTVREIDDFEFSSEIALVYVKHEVQRRVGQAMSLDKILCDPELAQMFDDIAQKLAPGYSALDYRWVALRVRKAAGRNLKQALAKSLPQFDLLGSTRAICPSKIPSVQGIYLFRSEKQAVFASHTDNLRNRIERHFQSSDNKGVPDWLYDSGREAIQLGIIPLPRTVTPSDRKLVEIKAVATLKPFLNIPAAKKT